MSSVDKLMPLLKFSHDDLAANRQGKLGDSQIARLKSLQSRALWIGMAGFFGFAFAATICLFFGSENGFLIMTLLGVFLTLVNALFVGVFARQWMRLRADLDAGEIDVIQGELERVVKANGRMNNFLLRIEDEEFYVNKEVFLLFQHEVDYAVYRTRHSAVLLAAEPTT